MQARISLKGGSPESASWMRSPAIGSGSQGSGPGSGISIVCLTGTLIVASAAVHQREKAPLEPGRVVWIGGHVAQVRMIVPQRILLPAIAGSTRAGPFFDVSGA
jgi:hypothetical protein